jgi:cob(I)alamin adenosyltransferase
MADKFYTRTGDDGYTGVLGRERVPKYSPRTKAYGTVDEASAALGLARQSVRREESATLILQIQRDLYLLMADVATVPEAAKRPPWLEEERIAWLEQVTDDLTEKVEMPSEFIIPGDSLGGAALDLARTIVRRAERLIAHLTHEGELRNDTPLRYLNRLSSLLFVLARAEDKAAGVEHPTLARPT